MSLHASSPLGGYWTRSWWYWQAWVWAKRHKPTDPMTQLVYGRGPMLMSDSEASVEFADLSHRFAYAQGFQWDGQYWQSKLGAAPSGIAA